MKNPNRFFLAGAGWLAACALVATVARAGTGYDVSCKNAGCGFKLQAGIGGGMGFEEAAGYCDGCMTWVTTTWKRGAAAPAPLAEFWDPLTGATRQLHPCPKCRRPYVVVPRIEDLKYCPQCKQPTLEAKAVLCYD